MEIYVYSDESGVFDRAHYDQFVFGGLIFLSKSEKDDAERKYSHVEEMLRQTVHRGSTKELKADRISNKEKQKIYRSLNQYYKFGVQIDMRKVNSKVFENKKSKQRYLDYAYKIGLKRAFEKLVKEGQINRDSVGNIHVFADEHSTATNGLYELRESLEAEFKRGTFNYDYMKYFEPLFPTMCGLEVKFCDSACTRLVRASDIIANHFYFEARKVGFIDEDNRNVYVHRLP